MSSTTEFAELHEMIGSLRRRVTSLASQYGDSPTMRRIVNDIDRLDIDIDELELTRGVSPRRQSQEKIAIPDTEYGRDFWQDVDDEGVGGHSRG
jgi:hypothetical protein